MTGQAQQLWQRLHSSAAHDADAAAVQFKPGDGPSACGDHWPPHRQVQQLSQNEVTIHLCDPQVANRHFTRICLGKFLVACHSTLKTAQVSTNGRGALRNLKKLSPSDSRFASKLLTTKLLPPDDRILVMKTPRVPVAPVASQQQESASGTGAPGRRPASAGRP